MTRGGDDTADIRRLIGRRAETLAVLVDGRYDKSELTAELDVSRSTIDRTIRRLETSGFVRRDGSGVTATLAGRLAYDSYRRYCAETADVARFGDLLRELPPAADVGHELLDGATAHRSEPPATGRPANEVTALIADGTRLRACASVINDAAATTNLHGMVTEEGGRGSVVYTERLADHVRRQYFRMHHEMIATDRYRAYEIADLPYELFLVDTDGETHVVVMVYDETGTLCGTIVNDTDAAVAWGEAAFERYRAAATEFTDDFRIGGDDADEGNDEDE
jgi:predicted transcriptional regulator